MRGRIEREIRLLPPVLACSVDDDVVALVAPDADPEQVASAIETIVRDAGADLRVRVVGGVRPSRPPFILRFRSRPAKLGLVASGAAALLTTVFVGARAPFPVPPPAPPSGGGPAPGATVAFGADRKGPSEIRILALGLSGTGDAEESPAAPPHPASVDEPPEPSGGLGVAGNEPARTGRRSGSGVRGGTDDHGGHGGPRLASQGGECREHEHSHGGHAGGKGHEGWSKGRGHDGHGRHLGHGCDD